MADRSLTLRFIGKDQSLGKTLQGVGRQVDTTQGKMSRLGSVAGAALGGAAALGAIQFGKASVQAFAESEEAQGRLAASFAKFPKLADSSVAALQGLNEALARKTKFDDDALASGQSVLAQFNLTGKQIESLTPLLADYAAKTGKDLPSAAQDLGKAVMGQGKALKGVGLNLKDTGTAAGNLEQLMAGLNTKVGGFATDQGKTAAGQAEILKNQFGELQETVGAKLVPMLMNLAVAGLAVVDFMQRNSDVLVPLVGTLGGFVALVWAVNAAARAYAATQAALNVVMAMNPIGLVVIAIAALAAGLVFAYKKSETFRDIVDGAFKAISTAASFMWDTVLKPIFRLWLDTWFTVVGALVNGAASAFGWVPGIGPKLKAAATQFNAFRDSVNNSLDGIVSHKTVTLDMIQNFKKNNPGAANDPELRNISAGLAPRGGSSTTVVNVQIDKKTVARAVTTQQADDAFRGRRNLTP